MKLDDAVRALRGDGSLPTERKRIVRERVLARPRPTRKAIVWVLPIAAALAATTVWAGITGHWFRAPPREADRPAPSVMVPAVENVALDPIPSVASTAVVPTTAASSVAVRPSVPDEDTSLRAYREAERLQRVEKDCDRAVPAWDAYIARAGSSPLVVDARYNRGLCLVRLGRANEARAALAPFARGEAGSYRQSEANALLRELDEQ